MAHTVLCVPSVGRVVAAMSRRERQACDAAVQALNGEGCRAGGKRLAAIDDADYPMCQRSLYGDGRMTTIYRPPPDGGVVERHTVRERTPTPRWPRSCAACPPRDDGYPSSHPAATTPQTPPTLSAELDSIPFELFDA